MTIMIDFSKPGEEFQAEPSEALKEIARVYGVFDGMQIESEAYAMGEALDPFFEKSGYNIDQIAFANLWMQRQQQAA